MPFHSYFTVDLTYIRSFSSDSSVLSFQFSRVSPSVSGFEVLALEDEDEDSYYYYLYYCTTLILFRCIVIWYVYSDMYCINKSKVFVNRFMNCIFDYYILSFRCEILFCFISSLFFLFTP